MKYELVTAEALPDPASATLYRWSREGHLATEGPYAETEEHLAGFFMLDVVNRESAEEIASVFAQPGGVVELRPAMWPGGDRSRWRCCSSTAIRRCPHPR